MLAICGALAAPAYAQEFPTRPIRAVIPYGVGGSADVLAHVIAPGISAHLGQSLVISEEIRARRRVHSGWNLRVCTRE